MHNKLLLLATSDGLILCRQDGERWHPATRTLQGHEVTTVIAREGVILAGTTHGIFRSDDRGQSWREASNSLAHRHVRWLAYHPAISDAEFAGTEPAALFVSRNGGESWREAAEVGRMRERYGWFLPYSPEAGCVRSFTFHGARGYAAVEVGGVLRSDDYGTTWELAPGTPAVAVDGEYGLEPPAPFIPPDVHAVAVHPGSPDLLFAATHKGLYRSADGGAGWERISEACYCRALWLDPGDPDHIIFGPATRRGWHGSIAESFDGGEHWQRVGDGLELPWESGRLVERFVTVGPELLAVISDGTLFAARLPALQWRPLLPEISGITAATTMAP